MTSMPALQYLPLPVSASAPLPPSRVQTTCCLSRSNPSASMKRTPFEAPQHTPTRAAPVSQSIPAFSPPPTLSSSVRPGSPSDSSPVVVCCDQTSSGSSNTSLAAPCSPVSPQPAHDDAPQPISSLEQPALPKIRRIHIDFNYRKPTPNLNPVEPTPEELLAKDFRFLTHEPRQPLYRPAVLRKSRFYPPTQPPAGSLDCCYPAACLHAPQSPVSSLAGSPDPANSLSPTRARPSRSSFTFASTPINPLRAVPHTLNTVIIDSKKFGRVLARSRWVPDIKRESCAHDNCPQRFSFINRKHHCRSCGEVFCRAHASQTAQLFDGAPGGEPTGKLVTCRVCDTCAVTLSCGIDPISPRLSLCELVASSSSPPSPATKNQALSDSITSTASCGHTSQHSRPRRARPECKTRPQSSKGSQTTSSLPRGTSSGSSSHLTHSPPHTATGGPNLSRSRQTSTGPAEVDSRVHNCVPVNSKPYHPFPAIPLIDGGLEEGDTKLGAPEEPKWPDREEETEEEEEEEDDEEDHQIMAESVVKYQPSRMFW